MHDEQIINQRSDERTLKVKTPRTKNRKSPYQLQASAQQHPQSTRNLHPLQSSPTRAEISPSWQAPSAHKWYPHPQTKSPLVHTPSRLLNKQPITEIRFGRVAPLRKVCMNSHQGAVKAAVRGITPQVSIPLMIVHLWAAERTFIGSRAVIVCSVHSTRQLQHSNRQKTGIKRQRMGHTINS